MATHRATLLAAAGVDRFAYKEWSWPQVGASQVIGDDAKTYLLANRAGWFSYAVEDGAATIETPDYADSTRLSPTEREQTRKLLESTPDDSNPLPLQVPRVADAAALAALTGVHDGDLVYQLDTDVLYLRHSGAWVALRTALDAAAGTFAVPTVADAAGLAALGAVDDGTIVYQLDTDEYQIRLNGAWHVIATEAAFAAGALAIPAVADDAAKTALGAVDDGTIVYQTDTNVFYLRLGGAWKAILTEDDAVAHMTIAAALGAEAGNVIRATLMVSEAAGDVLCELLTGGCVAADPVAGQALDVVTGTALSDDVPGSNGSLLMQADAGSIVLDIIDKSALLAGDVWLKSTQISQPGKPLMTKVTFA